MALRVQGGEREARSKGTKSMFTEMCSEAPICEAVGTEREVQITSAVGDFLGPYAVCHLVRIRPELTGLYGSSGVF